MKKKFLKLNEKNLVNKLIVASRAAQFIRNYLMYLLSLCFGQSHARQHLVFSKKCPLI